MKIKNMLLASGAFGGMTPNERRLGRFLRDAGGHPEPAPAAAPTSAPAAEPLAPEPTGQDAFDAAFAENAAEPAAPGTDPAPESAPAPEPAPAEAPPVTPAPAAEPPAATPEGAPPAAPAPEPAKPGLNAEDVLSRLADLVKPGEAAPAPAAPSAEAPAAYTPEEQGILVDYEKNWPDVARAEQLKRRAEYSDLLGFVFGEITKYTAPLFEQQRAIGNTLHMTELKGLVPDYTEDLETSVASWVDTQPSYLQAPYKQVMQGGTSEEIADLIGRYRSATGNAAPAPAPTPAPAGQAPAPAATPKPAAKTELSSAAKQAAESLAPVSGDRSAVPQGEDTQDFDSAFARYAADMK